MNYVLKSIALEHIALMKIATTLWNRSDIRELIASFSFPSEYNEIVEEWEKIDETVVKRVAELPLPKPLKEKISNFIKPIGWRILKWKTFLYQACNIKKKLPHEFHWAMNGTIDEMKTAEVLIKDESIDTASRYRLSCIFCLEKNILGLWNEMPEECKKSFNEDGDLLDENDKLVAFWKYQKKGELAKLEEMINEGMGSRCSAYRYATWVAARCGNKAATQYFVQKLSPEEKKKTLENAALSAVNWCFDPDFGLVILRDCYFDVLYFLLSQMDEESKITVIKTGNGIILRCLLEWPYQSFYMETVNLVRDSISEFAFGFLLHSISCKMRLGYKDYDYKELLKEFWEQSPNFYKRNMLMGHEGEGPDLFFGTLYNLFELDDHETIHFLYRDATLEQKQGLFYSKFAINKCSDWINLKKLDSLKFFIKECLPTKGMMTKAKEDFENGLLWRFDNKSADIREEKWQKFRHILKDLIAELQ